MINLQALLDAGIDAEVSGKVAEAMALDAAADAVVLKAKDDTIAAQTAAIAEATRLLNNANVAIAEDLAKIAALQAAFDAYKASHPDVVVPPPPPVDPVPPTTGWPDASNTGAKGTLTAYTGPMTITTAGVTIQNKTINGTLRVTGANFVMKNCRLTYTGTWGVDADGASNVTIQDCTIVGPGSSGKANAGILGQGIFLRNDLSKAENGLVLMGGKSVVKGNFIHDLSSSAGNDGHYDGISVQGGQDDVLIEGNAIFGRDTSDVFIKNDFGSINNIRVNANYLAGNPGYLVYSDNRGPKGKITNVSITNNVCPKKGGYGYWSIEGNTVAISGNVNTTGANIDKA